MTKLHRYNKCSCGRRKLEVAVECQTCHRNRGEPSRLMTVKLFAEGTPMKQIGDKMRPKVTRKCVEYHMARTRALLGVPSNIHVVQWALKEGLARFVV